jgi:CheY-like chemotaxis protein
MLATPRAPEARVGLVVEVEYASADDFVFAFREGGVGECGLFVPCDQPCEAGTDADLVVTFVGLSQPVRARGHVAWRRRPGETTEVDSAGMFLLFDDEGSAAMRAARGLAQAQLEARRRPPAAFRVLVVDDSPETRRLFVHSAQRLARQANLPLELVEAADGASALAALEAAPCDLAIVDYHMPIMDGRQLVERIRSDPRTARLPVAVVSHDPGAQDEALRAGASIFLLKPVTSKKLLETLVTLLDLNRA